MVAFFERKNESVEQRSCREKSKGDFISHAAFLFIFPEGFPGREEETGKIY